MCHHRTMSSKRTVVVKILSYVTLAAACFGLATVLFPRPANPVPPTPIVVIVGSAAAVRWVNVTVHENTDGTHDLVVGTSVDPGTGSEWVNLSLWVPGSDDSLVTCEPTPESCTQTANEGNYLGRSPTRFVQMSAPTSLRPPSTLPDAFATFRIANAWKPMECSESRCAGYITTVLASSGTEVAPDAPAVVSYEGSRLGEYEWTSSRIVPDAGNDVPTFMTPLPKWSYSTTRIGTPFIGTVPGSTESDAMMTFILGAVVGVGGGLLVAAIQEIGSASPRRGKGS
ncbi:hypothetical protein RKD05_002804 [Microbacterium sp. SLBN-111]